MKITAEYELYLDRRWEGQERRQSYERRALLRGAGWGLLFAIPLWCGIFWACEFIARFFR